MSRLDSETIYKIAMPILTDCQVIVSRSINKNERENIIMIAITEEEENALDNGYLHYKRKNIDFVIDNSCKPIYGKIDFNTWSDDYDVLETMNWLDHLTAIGIPIPSDYDYDTHCCYSPIRKVRWYDTTNCAVVAQYKHALLGKPERVCIFRKRTYGLKRT